MLSASSLSKTEGRSHFLGEKNKLNGLFIYEMRWNLQILDNQSFWTRSWGQNEIQKKRIGVKRKT